MTSVTPTAFHSLSALNPLYDHHSISPSGDFQQLPVPPRPSYSRHPSLSGSDASEPITPNNLLEAASLQHYPSAPAVSNSHLLDSQKVAAPGEQRPLQFYENQAFPMYQAPFAREDQNDEDGGDQDPVTEETSGDFAQTFYDPFRCVHTASGAPGVVLRLPDLTLPATLLLPHRIKHRRRTSPAQLKILEHHFDRNPKPDVSLRKALSERLDMTPREVQVWFQNRRAKNKKLREKQDKDGLDEGGSPDSPYASGARDIPPSRSHGVDTSPPRSFINEHHKFASETNMGRRGSSPAVLNSGLSMFEGYYEPQAPPRPFSRSFNGQGNSRPSYLNGPLGPSPVTYPSPISLHNGLPSPAAHSPNDRGFHYPQPGMTARPQASEEPAPHSRRFSLPAYIHSYPPPASQWGFPSKEAEDGHSSHASFASQSSFASSGYQQNPYNSSTDYNGDYSTDFGSSNGGSRNGRSPDFGAGAMRDEGSANSYAPNSSGDDDDQPPRGHRGGAPVDHHGLSQYTFGMKWRPESDEQQVSSTQEALAFSGSSLSPTEQVGYPEGRRASCPAGFVPGFDNLGISSPSSSVGTTPLWPPAYAPIHNSLQRQQQQQQPHQQAPPLPCLASMQKRHSFSAPYPTAPMYAPLPVNPQFLQQSGRRGSTSSLLGTINEQPLAQQPSGLSQYAPHDDRTDERGVARKSRSSASLRQTQPYQLPASHALLQDRRGSGSEPYFPLP
ncbi:hypothetical protein P7C70_g1769, partial [Phenoliferia sp. Uapishka_3]